MALFVQGFADLPQEWHTRAFYYPLGFAADLEANHNAHKPPGSDVGIGKGIWATTYDMQTFREFLAKKAVVLPNLFRIEPFIGLAQPIPLEPKPKPRHPLGGGERP